MPNQQKIGLIGHWVGGGSGNNWMDSSPYKNNGALRGSPVWTLGKNQLRNALSFDGVDDGVTASNNDIFDLGTGAFSFSTWIKTSSTANGAILLRYSAAGGAGQVYVGISHPTLSGEGKIFLYTWASGSNEVYRPTSSTVNDGEWHHFVGIRDGATMTLYVDGQLNQGTQTNSDIININSNGNLCIGYNDNEGGSPAAFLNGSLDDVRIYNRALSQAEVTDIFQTTNSLIRPVMAIPTEAHEVIAPAVAMYRTKGQRVFDTSQIRNSLRTGLIGHWIDNGSGNTLIDRSGYGNHGDIKGSPTRSLDIENKRNILTFDGSDDRVVLDAAVQRLAISSPATISFRLKSNTSHFAAGKVLFTINNNNANETGFGIYWGAVTSGASNEVIGIAAFSNGAGTMYYYTSATEQANDWHHLTIVCTGSNWLLYWDGKLQSLVADANNSTDSYKGYFANLATSPVYSSIGSANWVGTPASFFNGSIDDVRIYNRTLSEAECLELARNTDFIRPQNRIVANVAGGETTVDITNSLQYAIATTQDNTKTLKYTIPATQDITKSLEYDVATTIDTTKSLKYAVPSTQEATKSLKYTVPSTIDVTKALKYTINTTIDTTKSLQYAVAGTVDVTKTLKYAVPSTSEVTKSLKYTVPSIVDSTKSLKYTVPNTVDVTKSLKYTIPTTTEVTKSLQYHVRFAQDVTKALKYTTPSTVDLTKVLQYEVVSLPSVLKTLVYDVQTTQDKTKSLKYSLVTSTDTTKSLTYRIADTNEVTKSLKYTVPSTQEVTKSLAYYIANTGDITKSLKYTVPTTNEATKSLEYCVTNVNEATKDLKYTVPITQDITKILKYSTPSTQDNTKDLRYAVTATIDTTKSLQYVVLSGSTVDVTENLKYAINKERDTTKALKYLIENAYDQTKALVYKVKSTVQISNALRYLIADQNEQTRALAYKVGLEKATTKSLKYTATTTGDLTKSLQYEILPRTEVTKALAYKIANQKDITKSLQYVVHINPYCAMCSPYTAKDSVYTAKGTIYTPLPNRDCPNCIPIE